MFDVIGKRLWFYLISAVIVVPGFLFIVLTPLTGDAVGLKFSIDYTGGTLWSVRFADQNVQPADVKAVLATQGYSDSTVTRTDNGYLLIRTKPIGLQTQANPTPVPSVAPSPSGSAGASGSPVASASAVASPGSAPSASAATSASPAASASAGASASPAPSGSAGAGAVTSPAPSPSPTPNPNAVPTTGELGKLATALQAKLGPISGVNQTTTIGPVISSELTTQAILLVILGSLGILLWITLRFHDVKMGVTAITALIHDVIVVVGLFAIMGTLFGVEVDALFVTAMLTIIGFSVHDTIVVFDRIRENKARHAGEPFDRIVNHSILQTFGRSINTSFTVVLTLLALLLFSGPSIRFFILALLIGIISGTYSSIFNASPLLVDWTLWEERRRAAQVAARPGRRAPA
ncbi:MAG: protein translocase subunit SecF [Candidatus Limnocylindrales bacterium]